MEDDISCKTRAECCRADTIGREATDSLLPVRDLLYNESSWCIPAWPGEKTRHGRKARKEERQETAQRRTRVLTTLRGPLLFGGSSLSILFERDMSTETEKRPPKKGGPRRGHVSRPGHLLLQRTHCYVPIISFTLAASHLPFSPFFFLPPSFHYLLALHLLVSRSTQLPFSLTYKADLRTCPSRRMTVNRNDQCDVLPDDREKK